MRKITVSTGIITTFAGTGSTTDGGDDGAASSASLFNPSGLGIDTSGSIIHSLTYSLTHTLLLCLFTS